MQSKTISDEIYSSKLYKTTDDSLKDEDNVSWVMGLRKHDRNEWITTLQWIRIPDRLLENELRAGGSESGGTATRAYGYSDFVSDWKKLRNGHDVSGSPFAFLFDNLKRRWRQERLQETKLKNWDLYIHSLKRYLRPQLLIKSMKDYERALYCLSGTFFQAFPFQPREYYHEIGALGTLDQFFNNLRDLHEDAARGVFYFPRDLLNKFSIGREELTKLAAEPDERFVKMNEYLLSDFAPRIFLKAAPLLYAQNLHYSWRIMIDSVLKRYARMEYVFRKLGFNAKAFSTAYWNYVRQDLGQETITKFKNFKSTLKQS